MIPDFTKYPICDADIWINLCLGECVNCVFEKHEILIFADVVENEILAFRGNKEYSYIAQNFKDYKEIGSIYVIRHDIDIPERPRAFMERTLLEMDFTHGLKNRPSETNKGEIVSALYADHFSIPFLKSNDGTFRSGNMGRSKFPDLLVKNWDEILNDYISERSQRAAIKAIVGKKRKQMNTANLEYKTGQAKEEALLVMQAIINAKRLSMN